MEVLAKIENVGTLQQRSFTDQQGQQQTFSTLAFVLNLGRDRIYCEAIQETAVNLSTQEFVVGALYACSLNMRVKTVHSQTSGDWMRTDVTLTGISLFKN